MSSKQEFPKGPTISGSAKYKDLVIGENCIGGIVLKIYGDTFSCSTIISKRFETDPGGAILFDNTLTNLNYPVNPSDAANKAYVDAVATGLLIKAPVQAATTGNIVLFGLQTIDAYNTAPGDRILVKDQLNGVENGLYNANIGVWTRTADLPTGSNAAKTAVTVENGTQNGGGTFVCTNTYPIDVVDTDILYFILFISSIIAGAGLSRVGNVFNVNVDNIGIEINGSNDLQLKDGGVTNAKLQNDSITINSGSGLVGGGSILLGSSTAISVDSTVIRTTGAQTMSGPKTFSDSIILGSGLFGINLKAPFLTNSYTLNLPINNGLNGQFLTTNGSGNTSWTSSSSGDVFGPGSSTDNAIVRFDGITGKLIQNSSVIISDTANITGVNSITATTLTDGIATLSGGIFTNGIATLSGGTLSGLIAPTLNSHAANKKYVDDQIAGIKWKEPAILATTGNIILSGLQLIDGILTTAGYRILVKDQLNPIQNGIYIADAGIWLRSSDLASGSSAGSSVVWIEEGFTQAETGFICTNDIGSDIVGLNPLTWLQFTGAGMIIAGAGLSKVVNTLNVNVDNSTIAIVANTLQVKAFGITNTQIANTTISNSKLLNSTIEIVTGLTSGLTGGAIISLGGFTNLSVDSTVVRTSGVQTISGPKIFSDSIKLANPSIPAFQVTLQASSLTPASYALTLPIDTGLAGQVLTTDGTGVTSWSSTSGMGDVVGPASSTDNAISRFDGITGKLIQNSLVIIDDLGVITGVTGLTVNGTTNTTSLFINSESIAGQRLYFGYDSIGLVNITSSYQTLVFNTNVIIDSGYTNTLGEITLTDGGTYEVSYHLQFQTLNMSGGANSTVTGRVEINGIPISGSSSSCYLTEANGNLIGPGTGKNILINASPGDIVRITFARTTGTTSGQTKPDESSLSIKRLRP